MWTGMVAALLVAIALAPRSPTIMAIRDRWRLLFRRPRVLFYNRVRRGLHAERASEALLTSNPSHQAQLCVSSQYRQIRIG